MSKSDAFDIQGLALRRLYVAGAVAVVASVVAWLAGAPWSAAVLIGWSAATLVFLTWVWVMIGPLDAKKTAQFAVSEDDSRAAVDMNVAYTAGGRFVEIQGSAENAGGGFDLTQMNRMVELAVRGCRGLMDAQSRALAEP